MMTSNCFFSAASNSTHKPAALLRYLIAVSCATGTALIAPSASALDYTLRFNAGAEYTNNANARPDEFAEDDVESSIGTIFGVTHEGPNLDLDMNYAASYQDYKNNTLETDNEISGSTELVWKIIDESLNWNFNHYITETLSNNLVADTRDNRETRQRFTTGPEYIARLTSVDDLILEAQFAVVKQDNAENEISTSQNNIDSERRAASATWQHALSRVSSFDIRYDIAETEFDNDSPDFDYQRISAGYNVRLSSGSYALRAGANRSERSGREEIDGFYASAEYRRDFGEHSLSIDAAHQLTDSSIGVDSVFEENTRNNFDEVAIVQRSDLYVRYSYLNLCSGCRLDLGYGYDEEDFKEESLLTSSVDNKEHRADARLTYRVNSTLTTAVFTTYGITDFDTINREDTDTNFGIEANWQATDKLILNFIAAHDDREVEPDSLNQNYDEMRFGISATYIVK